MNTFKLELGLKAATKMRTFNVVAFFVPFTFDPDNENHKSEMTEVNNITSDTITKSRWTKAPH